MQSKDDSLGMVYVRSGTQHPENAPLEIRSVRNGSAPLGAVHCYHCRLCVLIFNGRVHAHFRC